MPSNKERNALNDKYYKSVKRCLQIITDDISTAEEMLPVLNHLFEDIKNNGVSINYIDESQSFNGDKQSILSEIIDKLYVLELKEKESTDKQDVTNLAKIQDELQKLAYKAIDLGANPFIGDKMTLGIEGLNDTLDPFEKCMGAEEHSRVAHIFDYLLTNDKTYLTQEKRNDLLKKYIIKSLAEDCSEHSASVLLSNIQKLCNHNTDPYQLLGGWNGFEEMVNQIYSENKIYEKPSWKRMNFHNRVKQLHSFINDYDPHRSRTPKEKVIKKLKEFKQRIKFRGKALIENEVNDIKKGDWVKGPLLILDKIAAVVTAYKAANNKRIRIPVDPNTLSQYTGIRDVNNREIYENDIVKYGDQTYIVKWGNPSCLFSPSMNNLLEDLMQKYPETSEAELIRDIYDEHSKEIIIYENNTKEIFNSCEIVGNLYDTPELIKVSEKDLSEYDTEVIDK